ncbi:MATH and LRR domain-containing protein PFE0570w [Calliphora vicina]|uniref:MATH and LRR domain-containing protein PFE0570w n=1 Tax=Calliphora vicina TaxID=7373 RepID=UPI00325A5320
MLNKLKFNNLVISNKKGIQQSRIQTINKLVHKIRKLKTLLEKHPDNTKCKERIRKSTETMELLKKLKRVDIMKNVLLMDKPAPAVITNGLATPEEVGIALLCMNKVMLGLIKRFKTELQLNEAENSEWKEALMESSKRKQKIERTEEKRRKRLEMKQQKAMGRKREEWLEGNKQDNEDDEVSEDKELDVSTTSGWQVDELSNDNVTTEADEEIEKKSNKPLKRPIKEKPLEKKTPQPPKKQKVVIENIKETTKLNESSAEESECDEITEEIKPVKVDKPKIVDIHQNESPQDAEEEPEEEIAVEEEMVVDPFFITDTGENYLSTAVIKRDQNAEHENNEEKRDLHMIKLNKYDKRPTDFKDRRQQGRDNNQRDFTQNRPQNNNRWNSGDGREQQNRWNNKQTNDRDKFSQNKWNDRKNNETRDQDFKHNKSANNSDEQKLHPSWAAKQKLKPVITGFQGKKITFGDDDSSNQTQQQTQYKTNKPAAPKPSKSEQESLHPSWAAKQKLKPTITAFQGKKITFGNDE